MREMFFGTRERFTSVACPAINVGTSSVGWSNSGTFENGGGFVDESTGSHKEYDMSWNLLDAVSARVISDYAEKIYGSGPIYFYLPGTLDQNVFPADVAAPGRAVDGGASLVKGVRPAAVATPANNANLPVRSASYTLNSGSVAREIYLPVPSGYTLHLSGYGSATGTAKVAGDAPLNTVATNLATNPSFEATSGAVWVRQNFITNPSFEVDLAGWSASSSVISRDTSEARSGVASCKVVTTGGAALAGVYYAPAVASSLTAGQKVSASVWVKAPNGATLSATLTSLGAGAIAREVNFTGTGAWQKVEVFDSTVGAGLNPYVLVRQRISTASVTFHVDDAQIESGTSIGAFFLPGLASPDPDLTPSWTGTAHASPSILTGRVVTGVSTSPAAAVAYQSGDWSASGSRSLKILSRWATTGSGYVDLVTMTTPPLQVANAKGKTFTVLATARTDAARPQPPSLRAMWRSGTGPFVSETATAPNAPGVHDLRLVFTVPVDATDFYLRLLDQNAIGNPPSWWDNLLIVEGEYTGGYFDGSQPPALAKNLVPNPLTASLTGTTATRGTLSLGDGFTRLTVNDANATNGAQRIEPQTGTFTVGELFSIDVEMRTTAASGAAATVQFLDASGASLGARVTGTPVAAGPDFQPSHVEVTVPAGATNAYVWLALLGGTKAVGDTLDARNLTRAGLPFFDGSMPDGMWLGAANNSASIRYDTAYRVAWTGTANASTSLLQTGGNRVLTLDGRPQAFEGPTGVTFKASGAGNLTLSGLMAQLLPNDDSPVNKGWISGQGHSGVRFANRPQTSTYSAVLDKYSVSAKFVEVGLWE